MKKILNDFYLSIMCNNEGVQSWQWYSLSKFSLFLNVGFPRLSG